jgi:hypothetical protein
MSTDITRRGRFVEAKRSKKKQRKKKPMNRDRNIKRLLKQEPKKTRGERVQGTRVHQQEKNTKSKSDTRRKRHQTKRNLKKLAAAELLKVARELVADWDPWDERRDVRKAVKKALEATEEMYLNEGKTSGFTDRGGPAARRKYLAYLKPRFKKIRDLAAEIEKAAEEVNRAY